MKTKLVCVVCLLAAGAAWSGLMAMWTGRSEAGISVSGQPIWRCEYRFGSQTFWRTMPGVCASTMEVQ